MNRAANPVDLVDISWCSFGAVRMERMNFVLLIDNFMSIPSRGWTLRHDLRSQGKPSPMERIFSSPVQFEVRRSFIRY
jgi:hypothetical protein